MYMYFSYISVTRLSYISRTDNQENRCLHISLHVCWVQDPIGVQQEEKKNQTKSLTKEFSKAVKIQKL